MDRRIFEDCIQQRHEDIVRSLDLLNTTILDALVSELVIDYPQLEVLDSYRTNNQCAGKFISMMMTRPLEDWDQICQCLEKNNHRHVSDKIREAMQEATQATARQQRESAEAIREGTRSPATQRKNTNENSPHCQDQRTAERGAAEVPCPTDAMKGKGQASSVRPVPNTLKLGAWDVTGGPLPSNSGDYQRSPEEGKPMLEDCGTFSRPPDQLIHSKTMHFLYTQQLSVCCINFNHEHIGTGFYISQGVVCTCCHVIEPFIPNTQDVSDKRVEEGVTVTFYNHTGNRSIFFGVGKVLAYSSVLDYAFLALINIPIDIDHLENYGNPPQTGRPIHMIGFHSMTDKMFDTNMTVINVQNFISENRDKCSDQASMLIQAKEHIAYQCSSFHGCSGSPIFDNMGKVVAIHKGFIENRNIQRDNKFLIEYGVKIIEVMMHAHENFNVLLDKGDELRELHSQT